MSESIESQAEEAEVNARRICRETSEALIGLVREESSKVFSEEDFQVLQQDFFQILYPKVLSRLRAET